MPLTCSMTWEPSTSRWKKRYKGETYTISCKSLGVQGTKESSASAANAWWRAKKIEIDAATVHPHREHLDDLKRRQAWSHGAGEIVAARNLDSERKRIEAGGEPVDPYEILRDAWRAMFGGEPPEPARLREFFGGEAVWEDRIDRGKVAAEPDDRSVGGQVDRYLALEYRRHQSGDLSAGEFDVARRSLHAFRDWLGAGARLDTIDVDRWEDWWGHLLGLPLSREVKLKRWRFSRQFVNWLADRNLIAMPTNLLSRRFKFGGTQSTIRTVPEAEVRAAVHAANPPLNIALLLMANCGFTQVDVANLRQGHLDWTRGRLTHRRSKTARYATVPVVVYPLWPETLELLRPYRREGDDLVFRTRQGHPLVHDRVSAEGRRGKSDALRLSWERHRKRTGAHWQLKWIRKTSATLIKGHPVYGRVYEYFLGHAPESVAERHYAAPSPELLLEAVTWLHTAYGFGEPERRS